MKMWQEKQKREGKSLEGGKNIFSFFFILSRAPSFQKGYVHKRNYTRRIINYYEQMEKEYAVQVDRRHLDSLSASSPWRGPAAIILQIFPYFLLNFTFAGVLQLCFYLPEKKNFLFQTTTN